MQAYAEVLTYAIPFFFILILIEYTASVIMKKEVIRSFDTISSLSSGMTNSIKEVLGLAIVIVSYSWMVQHLAIFHIESEIWSYVLTFIGLDFAGYWAHRFEHEINLFWNRHIIHHSSEEFNLACALRQNVSAILGIFFFLLIPLAIIGVPGEVIAIVAPLHLFAQFWYHTRLIDKMGWLEYVIVTPSHHRVHHAINDKYLDRNFSQIFIVWDKMFGTFQKEIEGETPIYGVKRQVNTWNPILINFQHLWLLITDAWHTKIWSDKVKLFFMPTGWRPADREHDAPVDYIKNHNNQIKYSTKGSFLFHLWSWGQLLIHLAFLLFMFQCFGHIELPLLIVYGVFIGLGIFAFTSLMDRSKITYLAEFLRFILGFFLIYYTEGWFGYEILGYIVLGFLIVSIVMTYYFLNNE